MALITVNSNISIPNGATLFYRWKLYTNGVWSNYFSTTTTPYTFSIPHPINTNIIIEEYIQCESGGQGNTNTYITNFSCKCNIRTVTNLVVSPCDEFTNTYSISIDVGYECMRSEIDNSILAAIVIYIDNQSFTFQPALREGTETFLIEGLESDGLEKTIMVTCSN